MPASNSMIGMPIPRPTPRPTFTPSDIELFALVACGALDPVVGPVLVEVRVPTAFEELTERVVVTLVETVDERELEAVVVEDVTVGADESGKSAALAVRLK